MIFIVVHKGLFAFAFLDRPADSPTCGRSSTSSISSRSRTIYPNLKNIMGIRKKEPSFVIEALGNELCNVIALETGLGEDMVLKGNMQENISSQ